MYCTQGGAGLLTISDVLDDAPELEAPLSDTDELRSLSQRNHPDALANACMPRARWFALATSSAFVAIALLVVVAQLPVDRAASDGGRLDAHTNSIGDAVELWSHDSQENELGNTSCFQINMARSPLDIFGYLPLYTRNDTSCQDMCRQNPRCFHFSFDKTTTLCHLGGPYGRYVRSPTFVSGPADCENMTPSAESASASDDVGVVIIGMTPAATAGQYGSPSFGTVALSTESSTSSTLAATLTSTRTTTTTTSQSCSVQTVPELLSMYCFLVMMATGFEPDLVRAQVANKAGVFSCTKSAVFSGSVVDLGSNISSTPFTEDTSAKAGWGSWLNTGNFLRAWHHVTRQRDFLCYEWTVKVDADAVFFPDRLQAHLQNIAPHPSEQAIYIKNCPKEFGLLGPIEVFSRMAVHTYGAHEEDCRRISHPESTGEDGYIQSCMQMLKVQSRDDFQMLVDNYCSYGSCGSSKWSVAFHPYKNTQSWLQCWREAMHSR